MRIILFLCILTLAGCAINQKIAYKTDDLMIDRNVELLPAIVEVRQFEDNRTRFDENIILYTRPKQIRLDGKQTCINSEMHYRKEKANSQISKTLADHFNKARLFKFTYFDESPNADYYLTGVLNKFYSEQKYSTGAAIGASFGLIGAIATSGVTTPGKVVIDISDVKLFHKDGELIKDFGDFYQEYSGEFKFDSGCWCAFWNANSMLKVFNTQLVEKIRNDLAGVEFER